MPDLVLDPNLDVAADAAPNDEAAPAAEGQSPARLGHGETRADPIRVLPRIYRQTRHASLLAGHQEEQPEHLAAASAHAGKAAEAMYATPFDPAADAADGLRDNEHRRGLALRSYRQAQVDAALQEAADAERQLAALGVRPEPPSDTTLAVIGSLAGTALLGLAAFPAARVLGLAAAPAGALAGAAALLASGGLVTGALAHARHAPDPDRAVPPAWWLVAGCSALATFLVAAFPAAALPWPVALGLALLLFALFAVLLLQLPGLALAWARHRAAEEPWHAAERRAAAARGLLARREGDLAAVQADLDAHRRWVEKVQDDFRAGQQARAQAEATAALAHRDTVAENRGDLLGNGRIPVRPLEWRERVLGREN